MAEAINDKNDNGISPDLSKAVDLVIDAAYRSGYNQGVDSAMIEVLEKKRIYESIHRSHKQLPMLELFFDEIIVKLKNLK